MQSGFTTNVHKYGCKKQKAAGIIPRQKLRFIFCC